MREDDLDTGGADLMNSTSKTRGILEEDTAEGVKHLEGHSLCYVLREKGRSREMPDGGHHNHNDQRKGALCGVYRLNLHLHNSHQTTQKTKVYAAVSRGRRASASASARSKLI